MVTEKSINKKLFTSLSFLLLVVTFISLDPFFLVGNLIMAIGQTPLEQFAIHCILVSTLILILICSLSQLLGKSQLTWQPVSWKLVSIWGVLFVITYITCNFLYRLQQTQLAKSVQSGLLDLIKSGAAPLYLLRVIILSPLLEELIFRLGVMSLSSKWKAHGVDIILSSTLFSLSHLVGLSFYWSDFILYSLLSALLAIIYRTGKSVWYSFLAHSLWNLIASWGLLQYLLSL